MSDQAKNTTSASQPSAALSADRYLEALQWCLPALRHELRGSLNSALLNLELAHRALEREDVNKSGIALERARNENQRLSRVLPRMLSWFAAPAEADLRSCEDWCREIELIVTPALKRSGIELSGFEVDEGGRELQLPAVAARHILLVVVSIGSALALSGAPHPELRIEARAKDEQVQLVLFSSPVLEGQALDRVLERSNAEHSQLRFDGRALELLATGPPRGGTPDDRPQ